MKQLCANCGKRPAIFVTEAGGKIHTDARHDLCLKCKRSQKESDMHTRIAAPVKDAK